ncbi:MAG: hypothetical protein EU550_01515 [Promethearchaeota archaeon]|nr:MAG: hypothetical protein EU550_01515 [Candidatus Lokiarchaeota archaeon]
MENRLLNQFNNVITQQWLSEEITEDYGNLTPRELFELTYHTMNSVSTRAIFLKLAADEKSSGSRAILYSKNKLFTEIVTLPDHLKIITYFNSDDYSNKLNGEIKPKLVQRKKNFASKDKGFHEQLLKSILVERKLDECVNLVMLKDINRKVYFSIGDARESAAVIPLFMEADGSSLVQLALNKWMATAQNLPPEKPFPENHVGGLLKNLMQIKRWLLNLISSKLDQ